MKKHTVAELLEMYKEGEQCDSEVFSEQRSNLLLVTGNHYNRKHAIYWNRIRETRSLTNEQKLRLTMNHMYRISKIRKNLILTHCPSVRISPAQERDSQSQKSAELNQAVIEYAKINQNMSIKTQQFVSDFFDLGEVVAKIWWNPMAGQFKGFNQATDDDTDEPLFDETGNPQPDNEQPVFEGQLEIERNFAFNLIRDANVKTMDESPYLTIRKMVKVHTLRHMIPEDDERYKFIQESKDETYIIFDSNKQNYQREKGITTLKETYFRPGPKYPMGYYYIWLDTGILWEGELPFGIFPLVYEGHDETPTQARHRSPIKQLRPYQIEINRAASSQAEIQLTLGQDKLILQSGAKLTPGEVLPGVRAYHTTGRDPTILEGRTGEQWTNYISSKISEMYNIAEIPEEQEEKPNADAWATLFASMKQKKKFVSDAGKFEGFLSRLYSTYLDLARNYFPDDILIPAIGKSEIINIAEFRNTDKLNYRIKASPASDDLSTIMGKTLMINHVLQYVGQQLGKDDIGKLIRLIPFANEEKSFDDFTLDFDRSENVILQLDRGEAPTPFQYDNGPYMIKKLSNRMSKPDFQTLHGQIQQNYQHMITLYEQQEAEKVRKQKAMESDLIPTDGPMIKVAWYVKDPTNPDRSVQATLPANAINWLVERLTDQNGLSQEAQSLNTGTIAQIADLYGQPQTVRPHQQPGQPGGMPLQSPYQPGLPTNRGMMQ